MMSSMTLHHALPFGFGLLLASVLAACASNAGGTGGTGGAGGAVDCGGFDEPTATMHPNVRVTNARSATVYFNQCFPRFSVLIAGEPLAGELTPWSMKTCEAQLASGAAPCCGCELEDQAIAPGETVELPWSGLGYAEATLPDGCHPKLPATCYQGRVPASGTIRMVVHLFTDVVPGAYPHPIDPFDVAQSFEPGSAAAIDVVVN
jgi:hypothetical protein